MNTAIRPDMTVRVLAIGLIADLATYGCADWYKSPEDNYGPFGELGRKLFDKAVERIQLKNLRAGLPKDDSAEFMRVANDLLITLNNLEAAGV